MEEQARSVLNAQGTSWGNAVQEAARTRARLDALGERADSSLSAMVDGSAHELKEHVKAAVLQGRFADLTRKKLRIAASLLFELPIAKLKDLVVARPDSHGMLLDAFCNQWTDRREHPARRELATLIMGAPLGVRLLHRGVDIELRERETPAYLVGYPPPPLPAVIDLFQARLGCRASWQFTTEAIAAWIKSTTAIEGTEAVWAQLKRQPRLANIVLPALRDRSWAEGWPSGGGTAPVQTQVTVVIAVIKMWLKHSDDTSDTILDKLLRFSSFGDPRVLPISRYWRELQARDAHLFDEFINRLVREDLKLFFQHAMAAKDREEFWLHYLGPIRRTVAVIAKKTRTQLAKALQGTKEGRGVLERTRVAKNGKLSAFCLFFERIVVVEFSEVGNAAYIYQRDLFEQKIFPYSATLTWAKDLKRTDLSHEKILHQPNWQHPAAQRLRDYGIYPSKP